MVAHFNNFIPLIRCNTTTSKKLDLHLFKYFMAIIAKMNQNSIRFSPTIFRLLVSFLIKIALVNFAFEWRNPYL